MPSQRNSARRRSRRRRQRQREYRRTGIFARVLVMLAVVAAIVLGVAIFFRVNTVEVQGNIIYSQEQVVEASGLEAGDNLLMVNRAAVAGSIKARMPYVRDVSVSPVMPDTVVIRVAESELAALVRSDIGEQWYLNTEGRVLGSTLEGFRGQVVELTGFTVVAPKAGQPAAASEGQTENMEAALMVLRELEGTGIIGEMTALNAEKVYDLLLYCGKRLEIQLGSPDQLEYKIQYLQLVLEELEEYQTGIVDLTFDVKQVARFIPKTMEKEEEDDEKPVESDRNAEEAVETEE